LKILIVNGPNLDTLGRRETGLYGTKTLEGLQAELTDYCEFEGVDVEFFQSSIEGEIVNAMNFTDADGIVLNAGAYTHYSIAIRDAVKACGLPVVEVHITNIFDREDFRNRSLISAVAAGTVSGFGFNSYKLAISALLMSNA